MAKICVVCRTLPGHCWSCDNKLALREYLKQDAKTVAVLTATLLPIFPSDLIDIVWQYGIQPTKWVCGTWDRISKMECTVVSTVPDGQCGIDDALAVANGYAFQRRAAERTLGFRRPPPHYLKK